jgi:hypothetical protein
MLVTIVRTTIVKKSSIEYRRSLSEEEVLEGKIMVMKDDLKFFPKPFRKFEVNVAGKKFELALEAIDCQCRGPMQPHQHYWLPVKEAKAMLRWERGAHVVLKKEKDASYTLSNQ